MYHLAASTVPAWYAVAGALGGAILGGLGNQIIARQQRRSELERLDRQLHHDRVLRQAEMASSANRLTAQLAHDRRLRDLEHVRATFGPILTQAFSTPDLIVRLKSAISRREASIKQDARDEIADMADELNEAHVRHTREALLLAGIVGLEDTTARALRTLAEACNSASSIGKKWLAGEHTDTEAGEELELLDAECGVSLIALTLGLNHVGEGA